LEITNSCKILEQGLLAVEALLAVAVHLVEGLADGHAALLQLHLHQRQAIDQDGHVVAVGVAARLLELLDHLHLVAGDVLLVQQIDVLDAPVVKRRSRGCSRRESCGSSRRCHRWACPARTRRNAAIRLGELNGVERLQLHAHVGQQLGRGLDR
jgi:hypothetical protein